MEVGRSGVYAFCLAIGAACTGAGGHFFPPESVFPLVFGY
jgi:hypothetical protein